jgi:hypothetical protein
VGITNLVKKNQPLFSHPNVNIASLIQKSSANFIAHMQLLHILILLFEVIIVEAQSQNAILTYEK